MKKTITLPVVLVCALCLSIVMGAFITGCGESGEESGSVTSIRLIKYNDTNITGSAVTVSWSDGPLTFTADVEVTGKASRDFSLESSNTGVATASGKTVTLVAGGQTKITAIAKGDAEKKHAITLNVLDTRAYGITVTGGSADKETAVSGQTVTLTAGTEADKVFSDWTIDPPAVVMISPTQFIMPASIVTVTGNFADAVPAGQAPYNITNNYAQDSSNAFLAQWHNASNVATQTLQIVNAAASFESANTKTIQVTGELFEPASNIGNYPARNIFRTQVTGLSPATFYKYRMGEAGAWSKTFYHLTSGGSNKDFSFTVVSDPQNNEFSDMVATLKAANDFDSDNRFFLMCGDIVNYIGLNPNEIFEYTKAANEINVSRPIAATQGNHDTYHNVSGDTYMYGEATVFNAFVTFPDNSWHQGAQHGPNRSKSYYFYYNNVLVIMLNAFATASPTAANAQNHALQAAWLKEVLETDRNMGWSKFTIVASHVGPFSGRSDDRFPAIQMREAYGKICTDYGVDIYFSGHDHVYTRSHPMKIGTNTALSAMAVAPDGFGPTPGGTVFSIASATGPKFYAFETATYVSQIFTKGKGGGGSNAASDQFPGIFVNVKVSADRLTVTAKQLNQTAPVDTYTVDVK